jgi:hypothetical protein
VFRRHVGAALIARDHTDDEAFNTWGTGSSASSRVRDAEARLERRVSEYLGQMSVLWVEINDAPGPESLRALLEQNAIALLSKGMHPIDRPSDTWLGSYAVHPAIRRSGLWNINHVGQSYDPHFLDLLAEAIRSMTDRRA